MKKVLVTGSNGQLGSEIRSLILKNPIRDLEFIFTDIDNLDISQISSVKNYFESFEIQYIVNCAAYTNVDKAESDIENASLVNFLAVKNLAQVSVKYSIPVIHVSTDYVFDGQKTTPYTEKDTTNPVTAYGKSKLAGEEAITQAYKYIIIRTAWLYSTFGHNFVKTMLRLGADKDEINVVNDQTGSPTYGADLAKVIIEILQQSISDKSKFVEGIYHYSNEGVCTWYDFAKEIMSKAGLNCVVHPVNSDQFTTVAKRPAYSLLDKTKLKQTFSIYVPSWKDSLKVCLDEIARN
jgi:dTDP-4-dehydrorhamnose reductase